MVRSIIQEQVEVESVCGRLNTLEIGYGKSTANIGYDQLLIHK